MPILFCFSRLEEDFYRYENKKICMMLIDLLLSKGADINLRIDKISGYTILMKLAANEYEDKHRAENTFEILQFLIERGANIYIRGNDHKSVFDLIQNNKFHHQLLKILNNTNQTVFFNTVCDESEINETVEKSTNKFNHGNIRKNNFLGYEGDIVLEKTLTKMNCCLIY